MRKELWPLISSYPVEQVTVHAVPENLTLEQRVTMFTKRGTVCGKLCCCVHL